MLARNRRYENARKAALDAALVEVRRAEHDGSVVYLDFLTERLRREYPDCRDEPRELGSEITMLATREGVRVVKDVVFQNSFT